MYTTGAVCFLNPARLPFSRRRNASVDSDTVRAGSVAATLTSFPITSRRASAPNGPMIARPKS